MRSRTNPLRAETLLSVMVVSQTTQRMMRVEPRSEERTRPRHSSQPQVSEKGLCERQVRTPSHQNIAGDGHACKTHTAQKTCVLSLSLSPLSTQSPPPPSALPSIGRHQRLGLDWTGHRPVDSAAQDSRRSHQLTFPTTCPRQTGVLLSVCERISISGTQTGLNDTRRRAA